MQYNRNVSECQYFIIIFFKARTRYNSRSELFVQSGVHYLIQCVGLILR
jgi:hypothetical protein